MAEHDESLSKRVGRDERMANVIADVTARRLAGEDVPDKQVIAEHPDLIPELAEKLKELARILEAPRRADETIDADSDDGDTISQDDVTQVSATQPLSDSLPGYSIIREIHRGGQGVVYQAIHKSTNRKVAIKVLKEGPFAGPSDKARFEREAQILGQLKHPNIVTIHDSGSAAGVHYFVMDYISGQPLDVYMAGATERHEGTKARRHEARERGIKGSRDRGDRPGLSVESTLRLFQKICEAVNAAHLRGVIHRDLKPGNIRIDADGQPHLLDFGLAKVALSGVTGGDAHPTQAMTMTGQFIGSLPWASPEQAEAAPSKIDVRTDVYSLGVILYQMLTGKFPYEVVGNMRDVLDRIMKAEPERPSTVRVAAGLRAGRINDEVDTIVLKCLSKERERRYQTAGVLADDIKRYLAGEPIEAKRDSFAYLLKNYVWRRRGRMAFGGLILVLVTSLLIMFRINQQWKRATEQLQRDGWLVALKAPRSPAGRDAVERLIELVAAGESTAPERYVLADALFTNYFPVRQVLSLDRLPRDESGYHLSYTFGFGTEPDFGGLVTQRLNLDGAPVWSYTTFLYSGSGLGVSLQLPGLGVGRHVFTGVAEIKLGRYLSGDWPDVKYELFDAPATEILIQPWEFVVVERYPDDYPTRMSDDHYARRFLREFRVESLSIRSVFNSRPPSFLGERYSWISHTRVEFSEDDYDALCLEISFPTPPLDIACAVHVAAPDRSFEYTWWFVAAPFGTGRVDISHTAGLHFYEEDQQRSSIAILSDLKYALGTLRPSELVGAHVSIEVTPSRSAALRSTELDPYLGVQASVSARIEDSRALERRAAERVVYDLLDSGERPAGIIRAVQEREGLTDKVRQESLRMAKSLFSDAQHLNRVSWTIVRRPGADAESYRRAMLYAEGACDSNPDDGYFLNTLGIAQYRADLHDRALETLTHSDKANSERFRGGHPADVAFIAMSLHQLGRTDESREALERLRMLMQKERWANDEESRMFLQEAEALTEGRHPTATSQPTNQP